MTYRYNTNKNLNTYGGKKAGGGKLNLFLLQWLINITEITSKINKCHTHKNKKGDGGG